MALRSRWKSKSFGRRGICWSRRRDVRQMQKVIPVKTERSSGQFLLVIVPKLGRSRWVRCWLAKGRLMFYDLTSRKFVRAGSVLGATGGFLREMRRLRQLCRRLRKYSMRGLVLYSHGSTSLIFSTTSGPLFRHGDQRKLLSFHTMTSSGKPSQQPRKTSGSTTTFTVSNPTTR